MKQCFIQNSVKEDGNPELSAYYYVEFDNATVGEAFFSTKDNEWQQAIPAHTIIKTKHAVTHWLKPISSQQPNESDAVEFAKWISEKASSTNEKDIWLDEKLYEKTTEELYQLFLKQK